LGARGAEIGGSTFGARGAGAGAGGSYFGARGAGADAGGSYFGARGAAAGGAMSRGIDGGGVGARIGGCIGGWPRPGLTPSSDHAAEVASRVAMKLVVTHRGATRERRTEGRLDIVRS
jgi:hypothetical protein